MSWVGPALTLLGQLVKRVWPTPEEREKRRQRRAIRRALRRAEKTMREIPPLPDHEERLRLVRKVTRPERGWETGPSGEVRCNTCHEPIAECWCPTSSLAARRMEDK